ncbi:MAG: phosphonate C-P lyase system protein PhnH [Bauldia sp.]|nr:phosphonate C-P lyase system protein PhnH [Bauldia sp.]
MIASDALTGGFADPVFDAQAVFRAVLDAFAHPGRVVAVGRPVKPPAPLAPVAAAVVAALADEGTPIFLDPFLSVDAVCGWIAFHVGAPIADSPANAAFALIGDPAGMPRFAAFGQGTAEYPDRSTTLVIQVTGFAGPKSLHLSGPGIKGSARIAAESLPPGFAAEMQANRTHFPRGVDVVLAAPEAIVALPRSIKVKEAG